MLPCKVIKELFFNNKNLLTNKTLVRDIIIIIFFAVLFQIPFLDKPFHIDDIFTIFEASQILKTPLDPYCGTIYWFNGQTPLWAVSRNPPLIPYLTSPIVFFFGCRESILHAFFIIFPLICGIAFNYIARHLCSRPLIATILFLSTPAFLLSSQSTMLDIPMLAFFLASIACYLHGIRKNSYIVLGLSGIFMAAAGLTKYPGFLSVPLLAFYGVLSHKDFKLIAFPFVIPLAAFVLWISSNYFLYGKIHMIDSGVAIPFSNIGGIVIYNLCAVGSVFVCPIAVLFFFRKSKLLALFFVCIFISFLLTHGSKQQNALNQALLLINVATGIFLVIYFFCISTFYYKDVPNRNENLFLAAWFWGIFVYASLLVYFGAVRFLLPLLPPVIILFINKVEKITPAFQRLPIYFFVIGLTMGMGVMLSAADFFLAETYRGVIETLKCKHPKKKFYFTGLWGFSYYAQKAGFHPYDKCSPISSGDYLVSPLFPCPMEIQTKHKENLCLIETIIYKDRLPAHCLNPVVGASFYSHVFAVLPYSFSGNTFREKFSIYKYK